MRTIKNYANIFIIGTTGSGKSTLLHEYMKSRHKNDLFLQKKYTTRPIRYCGQSQELEEYIFVDEPYLHNINNGGGLLHLSKFKISEGVYWCYGFPKQSDALDKVHIQSIGIGDINRMIELNTIHNVFTRNSLVIILNINPLAVKNKLDNRNNRSESARRYIDDAKLLYGREFSVRNNLNPLHGSVGVVLRELGVHSNQSDDNMGITIVEVFNHSYKITAQKMVLMIDFLLSTTEDRHNFIRLSPEISEISTVTKFDINEYDAEDILHYLEDESIYKKPKLTL